MFLNHLDRVTSLPLWIHAAAATATIAGFQWINGRLDASYAAAEHPADYATGQTNFSGEKIKGFYTRMQETGTLDVYWTTEVIDSGFILAIGCMGLFVCTFVARFSRVDNRGRRISLLAGAAVTSGAVCDEIENAWSFIMLSNMTDFADWPAVPYSALASLQFALIALGMIAVIGSLVGRAVGCTLKKALVGYELRRTSTRKLKLGWWCVSSIGSVSAFVNSASKHQFISGSLSPFLPLTTGQQLWRVFSDERLGQLFPAQAQAFNPSRTHFGEIRRVGVGILTRDQTIWWKLQAAVNLAEIGEN